LKRFIFVLSDLAGAEEVRKKIDERIIENEKDANVKNNLEYVRSFIAPNKDKEAILGLQKFYQEKIKFEEYEVNERMNKKEVELLESLISKDEKVLEMGCGAGRLIKELVKDGYNASGYDFTKRHVEITKSEIEKSGQEAKVFQGDWHNNAIKDGSLDTVYSLGRNILHDYSIVDQAQLFREAARILAHGGKFIFDIPNREKGGYKKMVEEYKDEMERRGIRNFRYGSIYDSPDGKHFATRYAYSHEDIEELARLASFRIVKVERLPLETGQEDENWYYVLEKL
jgi:SAM-dependent methyltransferase